MLLLPTLLPLIPHQKYFFNNFFRNFWLITTIIRKILAFFLKFLLIPFMINCLKIININYLVNFIMENSKQTFLLWIFLLKDHTVSFSKLNVILLVQKFFYDHFICVSIYLYVLFKNSLWEFIVYKVMELLTGTVKYLIDSIQQKGMLSEETSKEILVLSWVFVFKW